MRLRAKFSLLLSSCVLFAIFFTTATLTRFFTEDQESYLSDLQSSVALFAERQLENRMESLHSQVGSLLDAGKSEAEIAALVPCLSATRVPGAGSKAGEWALESAQETDGEPAIGWIGRFEDRHETVRLLFPPDWFDGILESSHGGVSRILGVDGTVLLRSGDPVSSGEGVITGKELFHSRAVLAEMASRPAGIPETRRYMASDGTRFLGTFLPLATEPPLTIAVATPWKTVESVIRRTYRQSVWVALACLVASVFVGIVFSGSLTSPLQALVGQTVLLGQGTTGKKGDISGALKRRDEVGSLARAFHTMERDLEKTRDTLRRAERLAALGKFSSSMAHEIKNPLSSILGNAQVAKRALQGDGELELDTVLQSLDFVEEETRRANRIINRLMRFARQDQPPKALIDLGERVRRSVAIMTPMCEAAGVRLETSLAPEPMPCLAEGDQLHEVLLNLVQNAIHAVKSSPVKEIRVSLSAKNGDIRLAVSDTGHGIPPEVQEHLFEPFFTTKPAGEGTGLGLAVCHGIILNHGGRIDVYNTPGAGAEFVITLPLRRREELAA